jgi:FMN phosphatase YigB (HAD superfamily)
MKAVLLDIGGVIVPYNYNIAYRKLADVCGLEPDATEQAISDSGLYPQLESGKIAPAEFVDSVSQLLRCTLSADAFYAIWRSIFLPGTLVGEHTLAALAARFRLIAVSDTNLIHYPYVRAQYPELNHFHAFALSFEVMAVKPSSAMFERALELANCSRNECIFVDDVQRNVEGATKLQIPARRFDGGAELDEFLLSVSG